MPSRPQLAASSRTVIGKKVARLRKEGRLPAVVFSHGQESEPVTIDAHEFDLLRRHVGASTLVDLEIDGKKARPVILHGIQVDILSRRPIHVDLFAVEMTEELTVEVQLVGTGIAPAIESGGTLVHPTSNVKVRALPGNLPETLHYDLSTLTDYDSTITLADLVLPEGVSVLGDGADVIARVLAPRVDDAVAASADESPVIDAPAAESAGS